MYKPRRRTLLTRPSNTARTWSERSSNSTRMMHGARPTVPPASTTGRRPITTESQETARLFKRSSDRTCVVMSTTQNHQGGSSMTQPTYTPPTPAPQRPREPQHQGAGGLVITGFVLAIVAIVLCFVPIVNNFAFVLAVVGLIFGIIGLVGASKGKHGGKGLAIAAIVISVVSGIGVLASQAFYSAALNKVSEGLDEVSASLDAATGDKTDELLGTAVDVQLGQFTATTGQYGITDTGLPVHVTNKTTESHSYSIHIEAVDAQGTRILDDYLHADGLGAGQSQDFKEFQFVSSDKIDAMKNAQFKVVEVSQY
ncbi:DUF4190 domain-containing protein [Pseudoclavibacter sp. 13-3]|uniref:DUF4190 domain-containing protein n=1 Tax=Pseudoclavibacter sp. 13-3 TaxID=2901228 RepID=UPI001E627FB6|nr:DUF4190 domain-containing protein [Pseudoclavibacter sp. 13-3]MCD7100731.1 DUF4190 domain-containing protein [Pseudoclavibacter sp. 13-3]